MAVRKPTKKYYFSVEGETEQWYLNWLQDIINSDDNPSCIVALMAKVQKSPVKYVKSLVVTGKTDIYHLSDYESDEPIHTDQFRETMDNLKKAKELGKQINYKFAYSNLSFDLWMVLHKGDCNGSISHRKNYINHLNRAYSEKFENMDQYKHEDNFKRCLKKLQLSNVIDAVNRAKRIMKRNEDNGYILHQYKGYSYYTENPSLAVWEVIEKILKDCNVI